MIYTVTCNPALDVAVRLDGLRIGDLNRTTGAVITPGGKGINVCRVAQEIGGVSSQALGFAAGNNGAALKSALGQMKMPKKFIDLPEGETRINVKLYGDVETELNAPGPLVAPRQVEELVCELTRLCEENDILCLCGSLPPGMGVDSYACMMTAVAGKGVLIAVDTTGEALLATLPCHPWLVKPNRDELAALVGHPLPTLNDVISAAEWLREKGAQNVLVSLGGDGALLCTEGKRLYQPAPIGEVVGTVGAGDSLLAGFTVGWQRFGNLRTALRLGVSCGSATAFSEGLATSPMVKEIMTRLPEMEEV